jgi:hypothetical protein
MKARFLPLSLTILCNFMLNALAQPVVELPAQFAWPANSGNPQALGFKVRVAQADAALVGYFPLPASSARAEAQLAGVVTAPSTGQLLGDVSDKTAFNADGTYDESNVIDYEQGGGASGLFPGIPGTTASTDNFSLEAVTFLSLTPGTYTIVVNSDDGFQLIAGRDARDYFNRIIVGQFEGGRGPEDSIFKFSVTQAGLYSFRLLYYEAGGGASLSWFSADAANPQNRVLINNTAGGGLQTYRAITEPRLTYVRFAAPTPNSTGVSPATALECQIGDGDVVQVDQSQIELYLNDVKVDATATKTGAITKVVYDPPGLLPPLSNNKVRLVYRDNAPTPNVRTNEYSFTVLPYVNIVLPPPLYSENFDSTAEGALPAGWSHISYTDQSASSPDIDFGNLDSAAYAKWNVVNVDRFNGAFVTYSDPNSPEGWENDYRRVLTPNPANIVNGQVITSLATGRMVFGNSGYRNGRSQVVYLFTPDYDLTGKTDVYLSFHSLWEQNQDSIAAVEYSTNQGQTWLPIAYMIVAGDVVRDGTSAIDAVATLNTPRNYVAVYTDPNSGGDVGGTYGAFIGAEVTPSLAPFINPRPDDDPVASKRVELFRLPAADNQAKVRFRFAHAGTDSWYFGIDDFGVHVIPPNVPPGIVAHPQNTTVLEGAPATLTVLAGGSTPLSYQWFRDGQPVPAGTAASLAFEEVRLADAGTYRVRVSNVAGEQTSNPATLTVTPRSPVVFGLWNFDAANLTRAAGAGTLDYADGAGTAGLTTFATTDGSTVPHINGQPAAYMRVPAFTDRANGYNLTMPMQPNGGGGYVNQYTMVADVNLPVNLNWTPFFNTAPDNDAGNDADFYVADDGSIGIADLGYSGIGVLQPDTWYRIAFVANLASGKVTYYVNGTNVFTRLGAPLLDGRFALYSDKDPGADLRLFNEPSGIYTHEILVNSLLFTDRPMTSAEVQAMGGPTASGIPAPAPPKSSITAVIEGGNLKLTWAGGSGIVLQKTSSLSATDWQDVPGTLGANSATQQTLGTAGFYRLLQR